YCIRTLPGLLVLNFRELGVDDIRVVLLAGLGFRCAAWLRTLRTSLRFRLLLGVDLLAQLLRRLRQRLALGFDLGLVLGLEYGLGVLERGLDLFLLGRVDLVAVVLERLLHGVYQRLGRVPRVDELERLLVFLGVRLGVFHHALDLGFVQTRARLDLDLVLLAGRLVLGRHVPDAVRVDVERNFNLRHAARRGRDVGQVELPERLVARGEGALALQHMDRHRGLVVVRGGE